MNFVKSGIAAALLALSGCVPTTSLGPALITEAGESYYDPTNISGATKSGTSCGTNLLGLIAQGDYSIGAAARAGGVAKIRNVDTKVKSYAGFIYHERCTTVYGN